MFMQHSEDELKMSCNFFPLHVGFRFWSFLNPQKKAPNYPFASDYIMCNEIKADMEPEWIWGDNAETTVYAQAYGSGFTIIFSFRPNNVVLGGARSSPLARRISAYYHDPSGAGKDVGFIDRTAMREELWRAVRKVWPECINSLTRRLDSVVDVDTDEGGEICWKTYRHPLFPRFIKCLGELACGRRFPAYKILPSLIS